MRAAVLAGALVGLAAPALHAAPAGEDGDASRRHAALAVDTSAVGESGPIIQRRVDELGGSVLRDAEILPARDAKDARIAVVVQELRGEEPGFAFELWIERDGAVLGERRRVECTLCTESEIVARIEQAIADAAEVLPVDEDRADEGADEGDPDAGLDAGDDADTDAGPGLGNRGKAGVGLLAVGVTAAGVGLGLTLPQPKVQRSDPRNVINTRPPGIGLLAGGGAAIVVGAVLLGLDRRDARRDQASDDRGPRWAIAPWMRRGGVGLSAMTRF